MNMPSVPGYTSEELLEAARWWCGAVVTMLQHGKVSELVDQAVDAGVPPGALIAMGVGQAAFLSKLISDLRGVDAVWFARQLAYGAADFTLDGPQ